MERNVTVLNGGTKVCRWKVWKRSGDLVVTLVRNLENGVLSIIVETIMFSFRVTVLKKSETVGSRPLAVVWTTPGMAVELRACQITLLKFSHLAMKVKTETAKLKNPSTILNNTCVWG